MIYFQQKHYSWRCCYKKKTCVCWTSGYSMFLHHTECFCSLSVAALTSIKNTILVNILPSSDMIIDNLFSAKPLFLKILLKRRHVSVEYLGVACFFIKLNNFRHRLKQHSLASKNHFGNTWLYIVLHVWDCLLCGERENKTIIFKLRPSWPSLTLKNIATN